MAKNWKAVELNLAKQVKSSTSLNRVVVPDGLMVEVTIQLDDSLYKVLSKNPTWLQQLQSAAKSKADKAVADIVKTVKAADKKATNFDAKTAKIFASDLTTTLERDLAEVSKDLAKSCTELFDKFKKGQADLKGAKIKCVGKCVVKAVVIAGSVTIAVVTGAALGPFAIYGIIKGGIGIMQELVKIASTANQIAVLIHGEFMTLKLFMTDHAEKIDEAIKQRDKLAAEHEAAKKKADATTVGKAALKLEAQQKVVDRLVKNPGKTNWTKSGIEIGLNVISKALGVESPSLKNCEGHIGVHKVNIAKLDKQSRKLSEKIYDAMDQQAKWATKFKKATATAGLNSKQIGKIGMPLDKAEKALDLLLKSTIKVNESIETANTRQGKFEKSLDGLQKGVPGWIKWVDEALALGSDIVGGIAEAASTIEKVGAAIITVEAEIDNQLYDTL